MKIAEGEKIIKLNFEEEGHKYYDDEGRNYTSVTTLIDKYKTNYDSEYWSVYRTLDQAKYKVVPMLFNGVRKIKVKNGEKGKFVPLSLTKIKEYIKEGRIIVNKPYRQVLKEWEEEAEEACREGNIKHDYMEECINNFYSDNVENVNTVADINYASNVNDETPFRYRFAIREIDDISNSPLKDSDPKVYKLLVQLINAGYTLYAEVRVYSYYYKISGTIDVLAVKGFDFIIVDWKTNKKEMKFYSGYYKKVWNKNRTAKIEVGEFVPKDERYLEPINDLQVCKGNTYTLQLSLYAFLCERWGYNCKRLILVHLLGVRNEDKDTKIYSQIKYLKEHVRKMLEYNIDKTRVVRRRSI